MKGDFTRDTFDPTKHYQQVLQQQGRVQLDADWNEQAALVERRDETSMQDLVGDCGGPADTAGFGLRAVATPGDFGLTAGRYYVEGMQCEVGDGVTYKNQPDLPGAPALTAAGDYLVFLDVWQRHVTALDDEAIREPALGGPDTATRLKTVWQVRVARITTPNPSSPCRGEAADLSARLRAPTPVLAARALPPGRDVDPCSVPLAAGYRGLENQLYRVEIHNPGTGVGQITAGMGAPITSLTQNRISLAEATAVLGVAPTVGVAIELFSVVTGAGGAQVDRRELAWIAKVDASEVALSHTPRLTGTIRARRVGATWKWSRDNGSIVFQIQGPGTAPELIDTGHSNQVKLVSPARDDVRSLRAGDWVEVVNDELELDGKPGQLLQVVNPDDGGVVVLSAGLSQTFFSINRLGGHPKLRRWDGVGPLEEAPAGAEANPTAPAVEAAWLAIEQGIQVLFKNGAAVRTGDYWQVPARTASSDALAGRIEWPSPMGNPPAFLPARGIWHQYGRLGVISVAAPVAPATAGVVTPTSDCRCLWPALTAIPRLFYVSGDGQEVMPYNPADPAATHFKLRRPLVVGLANPHCLPRTVRVRFSVLGPSNGRVAVAGSGVVSHPDVDIEIGPDGTAACDFHLDATNLTQQVEARLIDAAGGLVSLPIRFNANLSIASQVAYDPGDCDSLRDQHTVQDALDHLARQVSLHPVTPLHTRLPAGADRVALEVLVASRCGLRDGVPVTWELVPHGAGAFPDGSSTRFKTVSGDAGVGHTRIEFRLAAGTDRAVVVASIEAGREVTEPRQVAFVIERPGQALDEGIRIVDVRFRDGTALPNDVIVSLESFLDGIEVELDRPASSILDDSSIELARPIFTLTVDVPFQQKVGANGGGTVLIGYQPMQLAAKVRRDRMVLVWQPDNADALRLWLEPLLKEQAKVGLRVRLQLKGRFVWEEENTSLHLDGEGFGWPVGERIGIDLRQRSGDGRRGGDFEMWFWVRPQAPRILIYRPGWTLIAYPTIRGKNLVPEIFLDVPLIDGAQMLKFQDGQWAARSDFNFGEWSDPGLRLTPGEGAAFFNPSSEPLLVPQGQFRETPPPNLRAGLNLVGNRFLQTVDFLQLTGRDPHPGTVVHRLAAPAPGLPDPGGTGWSTHTFDPDVGWTPDAPTVRVGEAVFILWPG